MAFNTKSIIRDVNNKPVPQCFNPLLDNYEVATGNNGLLKVMIIDKDGVGIDNQAIANQIENKLDELIQAVT